MGLDIFVGKKSDLTKKTGHFRPWIIGDGKIRHWEKYELDQKNWTYSSSPIKTGTLCRPNSEQPLACV